MASYFWERMTGLTFAGRHSHGRISTPEHLQSTLHLAVGVTLLCIVVFFALNAWRPKT